MDIYDHIQPTTSDATSTLANSGVNSAAGSQPNSSIDKAAERLENSIETAFQKLSTSTASSKWAGATSGWASGLWSKVKQVGETTLIEAGKDIAAVRSEIDDLLASTTTAGPSDNTNNNNDDSKKKDNKEDSATDSAERSLDGSQETLKPDQTQPSKAGGNMLGLLSSKAQNYIDSLDRDLEVIENKAGSYLLQFGTDLKSILKDTVNVAGPTGASSSSSGSSTTAGESEVIFNVPEDIRNQIYSTRQDAQLHALHTSKEPFLLDTITDPGYDAFKAKFNIDKQTETITADLKKYPKLRTLMEDLTTAHDGEKTVRYSEFWTRYYFMREQIATQEERRKKVLVGADVTQEEELGWDDDDEDEDQPETTNKKDNILSSRPSSESSYDLVSNTTSATDLPAKAKAASATTTTESTSPATVTPEATSNTKSKVANDAKKVPAKSEDESDSDDDWE
ncbi:hypothetical protein D0Z03_001532 [Geotrichum reessii]|nr:hypothetical protein D0Z03_001532 [Galactomyces reessii]